jgi:hypothetical protein
MSAERFFPLVRAHAAIARTAPTAPAVLAVLAVLAALAALAAAGAAPTGARAPAYDICELQHSGPELDWKSPHQGEIVGCVGGIVTHKFRQRIVLQDPSLGTEWAAIEVRGYPVYPTGIEVGDQVDFDNVYVDEYRGVTTLQYYSASSHVVNSSGHEMPPLRSLSVWDLRYPAHPEDTEKYAAMLVKLDEEVTIGALDLGAHQDNYELLGEFGEIAWGSDYGNIDITSTYHVASGECYARLVGIIQRYDDDAQWDYYQLLPRGNHDYAPCGTDVEVGPGATGLRLSPIGSCPTRLPATIAYELPGDAPVRLEILDAAGRRVLVVDEGWRQVGRHERLLRGTEVAGRVMPGGVYYVRLNAAGEDLVRRLCLVR